MQKKSCNLIILFTCLSISCSKVERYDVIGVIKHINKEERTMLIDHEEIPGFMVKMEMFFNIHESVNLNEFSVNDSVSFDLFIIEKDSYTQNYQILGKSLINTNESIDAWDWEEDPEETKYNLREPGDIIDDFTFTNIYNEKVKLSDYKSKFIALSFVFSRCPMPNMCPASIYKNQFLANHFKDKDITFLVISFDYLYDTPQILKKEYGNYNTENLHFLSSYQHMGDIIMLTQQTGVGFWGVEENNIGHNMRTILLDNNLKVLKSFDGMDWLPGDAKQDIENLMKIYH
tara:strand:- start:460 stop:1323 length:864 start_codon:yes stop_codon:yes gene_type:complete